MRFRWLRKLLRLMEGRSRRGLEGQCSHVLGSFHEFVQFGVVILDEVSAGFGGKVEQVEGCFKDIKVLTGDGLLEFVHEVRDDVTRWS